MPTYVNYYLSVIIVMVVINYLNQVPSIESLKNVNRTLENYS